MRKENNFIIKLSTINSRLSTKGLTLIEVMIVVAILAVISSTLFSVFQSSLFSQRKGTNKAIIYSEARAALDMMSREIEKAFVDERKGIGFEIWNGDSTYRTGSIADEFYFVAPVNADNSNTGNYKGDLSEVGYWLQWDGPTFKNTLMRHYTSNTTDFDFAPTTPNKNLNSNALIGNVSDLQFQWWGWNTATLQYEFMDPPLSGYALPRAIKITLTMKYESEKDDIRHDTFITIVNIPGSGQ